MKDRMVKQALLGDEFQWEGGRRTKRMNMADLFYITAWKQNTLEIALRRGKVMRKNDGGGESNHNEPLSPYN
jgi:hypothetical protein